MRKDHGLRDVKAVVDMPSMDRADLTVEMAMDRVGTDMRQSRGAKFQCAVAAICLLLVALLAGCSRDPNVRKHKYLESGQRYFDKEQYREAAIQFENAIQVDQHFTDAHYKLALTALKLEQWPSAYQELATTIQQQPDHYAAHLY
ncbi:MAG: tetratricopeptide repeat protein, partial [Terriglobales bacterium]